MRFVVDDGAFSGWDASTLDLDESLSFFSRLLISLRNSQTPVGLVGGWGSLQVTAQDDLATVLSDHNSRVDKDLRRLLLGLLGKCQIWDEDPSIAVSDDDLLVDGKSYSSLGVAYAFDGISNGSGVGVLTMLHTNLVGFCRVSCGGSERNVSFVRQPSDCKYFYRSLYALEDVPEELFFELADKAFPDLEFSNSLNFAKFDGGYSLRNVVVEHLSALNDKFPEFYVSEHGNSFQISSRICIDVSIEGETRSSERLMALRDVDFDGRSYRCEWHSKLEAHRNRIHFYPGDASTDGRVLIGIFTVHLPT